MSNPPSIIIGIGGNENSKKVNGASKAGIGTTAAATEGVWFFLGRQPSWSELMKHVVASEVTPTTRANSSFVASLFDW